MNFFRFVLQTKNAHKVSLGCVSRSKGANLAYITTSIAVLWFIDKCTQSCDVQCMQWRRTNIASFQQDDLRNCIVFIHRYEHSSSNKTEQNHRLVNPKIPLNEHLRKSVMLGRKNTFFFCKPSSVQEHPQAFKEVAREPSNFILTALCRAHYFWLFFESGKIVYNESCLLSQDILMFYDTFFHYHDVRRIDYSLL